MLIARIIHVLAAILWVGGNVFLFAVAIPFARTLPPAQRAEVVSQLGRRFRPLGWAALLLLVGSGLYQMLRMGLFSPEILTGTGYGHLLMAKLILVAGILVLTAIHDFVLGPRVTRTGEGRSTLIALARANGALTVAVPVVAVILAH